MLIYWCKQKWIGRRRTKFKWKASRECLSWVCGTASSLQERAEKMSELQSEKWFAIEWASARITWKARRILNEQMFFFGNSCENCEFVAISRCYYLLFFRSISSTFEIKIFLFSIWKTLWSTSIIIYHRILESKKNMIFFLLRFGWCI